MTVDEGIAIRDGERLNIQCIMLECRKNDTDKKIPNKYHYHKYIEFLYVTEGERNVFVGDQCINLKKNCLFIIYANEPHDFNEPTDNKYYVIKFLPEVLRVSEQTTKEFEYVFNFNMSNHSRIISDPDGELKKLFEDSYKRFNEKNYSNEFFVRADLIRICGEILSRWHSMGEMVPISSVTGQENLILIQKVMEYAKKTNGAIKTSLAAKMCNMSDGHFSRIFKSIMATSFMQYVKNIKMEEAERLLKCTDKTITEISQELNYASASHFIEDFRKEKGISPKKYKKIANQSLF